MVVFDNEAAQRQFETFTLIVLAYLCFVSIAFLVGATALIFPRYILDEGLGIHADRARGPFLQAVANGVTLNMLGLLALDAFRRRRLRGWTAGWLLMSLPLAILATLTRAVWISFAGSIVLVWRRTSSQRLRRVSRQLMLAGVVALIGVLAFAVMRTTLQDRAEERGPVEIRLAVYQAGWQMFLERPFSGWGVNQMPPELAHRMSDYHLQAFWPHNTYLEILVEHGIAGLALYGWLIVGLFRLGRCPAGARESSILDGEFRKMWPVLVGVYLLNATFVVMNYQFVNGLLFTLAGMLAAQNRKAELEERHGLIG
jgi:O-antigen ligase